VVRDDEIDGRDEPVSDGALVARVDGLFADGGGVIANAGWFDPEVVDDVVFEAFELVVETFVFAAGEPVRDDPMLEPVVVAPGEPVFDEVVFDGPVAGEIVLAAGELVVEAVVLDGFELAVGAPFFDEIVFDGGDPGFDAEVDAVEVVGSCAGPCDASTPSWRTSASSMRGSIGAVRASPVHHRSCAPTNASPLADVTRTRPCETDTQLALPATSIANSVPTTSTTAPGATTRSARPGPPSNCA
jgi:hypothetical protein